MSASRSRVGRIALGSMLIAAAAVLYQQPRSALADTMQTFPPDFAFVFPINGTIPSEWGGPNASAIDPHHGYDIKGIQHLATNYWLEPIFASHSGWFTRLDQGTGCSGVGRQGVIEHRSLTIPHNSVYTRYHHLSSFAVPNNTWVAAGDLIGYQGISGTSGCTPHLHLEFRKMPIGSGVYLRHLDITPGISVTAGGPVTFDGNWVFYGGWNNTPTNVVRYGTTGDIPVLGDWDGDGKDSPGYVRVVQSGSMAGHYQWRLSDVDVDTAAYGQSLANAPDGGPFFWGFRGDKVLTGDWDDDGDDTAAIVRVDNPGLLNSLTTYFITNNKTAGGNSYTVSWGSWPGRWPIKGDWNGDGRDTVGVFWPETAEWFLTNNVNGGSLSYTPFSWGQRTAVPMSGDWLVNNADRPIILDKYPNSFQQPMTIYRKQYLSHVVGDLNSFVTASLGEYPLVGNLDADVLDEYVLCS